MEELTSGIALDNQVETEDFTVRVEYVLTVMSFSVLSLIYPYMKAIKAEKIRRQLEDGQKQLIVELNQTIAEIKTLRGIIPICSYCKKIRGDQENWTQLEAYLEQHSHANFSHGICPGCAETVFSEIPPGLSFK